jgi:LemA protein
MTLGGWIFLAIVVAVILFAVIAYNRLVALRRRSEAAWSDIDVQVKRRTDLVPNLVVSQNRC